MDYKLVVIAPILSILVSGYIINRVRKNLLNEKESIFWVFGCILMIFLAFFPTTLDQFSTWIGVQYPPATLFLIAILTVIILLYRQFARISVLTNKISDLVRTVAFLSGEVESLRSELETYKSAKDQQ